MYYTHRLYSIVHGNWGAWGAWSTCSETCGSGVLTRYRSCNSPPPANGGSDCLGNNDETTSCLTTPCPGIYLNPSHCEVYSIEHYVINYISELWQVGGFFPGTAVSSTSKTDRHDIAEILLKAALNTITPTPSCVP